GPMLKTIDIQPSILFLFAPPSPHFTPLHPMFTPSHPRTAYALEYAEFGSRPIRGHPRNPR
ncbi:MAG TPA: hypothetical protein VI488_12280, partial [Candidatus Angelobacter sp.]